MLGLLGLRIFEAPGADISDLGEEHGHRVLRVCGKATKVVLVPPPPAVGRAIDRATGTRVCGPILLNSAEPAWTGTPPPGGCCGSRRKRVCGSPGRIRTFSGIQPLSPLPEPTEARGNGVSADSCLADYLPRRGKPETDRSAPDKGLLLRCVLLAHTCLTCLTRGNRLSPGVSPRPREITLVTTMLDAGVDLRDVQIAAHADPRTTMRYDRARNNLDRHPNYILAAYMASGT